MSRLFYDTEFIDTGREIILLSIGVVRDDGATYYAENCEADWSKASPWVQDNVLPYLIDLSDVIAAPPAKTRAMIAADLINFAGEKPEWWAYMGAYDWVALSQLYGPLVNRPEGWPFYVKDVRQVFEQAGMDWCSSEQWVPAPANEHHALADAEWTKALWERIQEHCAEDEELKALVAWP